MFVHHWQYEARQRQTEQESSVMGPGYRQGTEGELQLEREVKTSNSLAGLYEGRWSAETLSGFCFPSFKKDIGELSFAKCLREQARQTDENYYIKWWLMCKMFDT